jgi:hypothetical protein
MKYGVNFGTEMEIHRCEANPKRVP